MKRRNTILKRGGSTDFGSVGVPNGIYKVSGGPSNKEPTSFNFTGSSHMTKNRVYYLTSVDNTDLKLIAEIVENIGGNKYILKIHQNDGEYGWTKDTMWDSLHNKRDVLDKQEQHIISLKTAKIDLELKLDELRNEYVSNNNHYLLDTTPI
jgi:hypothetical protein